MNSPHKWPVTRKMFPFDDVIMITEKTIDGIDMDIIMWLWICLFVTLDGFTNTSVNIPASGQLFSNIASDWFASLSTANQKPWWKLFVVNTQSWTGLILRNCVCQFAHYQAFSAGKLLELEILWSILTFLILFWYYFQKSLTYLDYTNVYGVAIVVAMSHLWLNNNQDKIMVS